MPYALLQEFVSHTDSGGRAFNYSKVLGAFTAGALPIVITRAAIEDLDNSEPRSTVGCVRECGTFDRRILARYSQGRFSERKSPGRDATAASICLGLMHRLRAGLPPASSAKSRRKQHGTTQHTASLLPTLVDRACANSSRYERSANQQHLARRCLRRNSGTLERVNSPRRLQSE